MHQVRRGCQEAVQALTPEWAADITGIEAAHIEKVAHDLASAKAGICYGRMGVSTQAYGTLCQWAIQVLNVITGNLDKPGGSLFTLPANCNFPGKHQGRPYIFIQNIGCDKFKRGGYPARSFF